MKVRRKSLMAVAGLSLVAGLSQSVHAATVVILADDFADAVRSSEPATIGAWDTVNGISAPSTSLAFKDGDSTASLGFFNKSANDGMIDVNNNMTAGGWDTTISLAVGAADIDLDSLTLDMRLTNGSGSSQTTGSKSGQMLVEFFNSSAVSVGSADLGGDVGYPTADYQRVLDLTGITLLANETYTMVVQARGTGFGHHKALDALSLEGTFDSPVIPEPASGAMALVGIAVMATRRRRIG